MHLVNVAVLVNFAYRTNLKTITISQVHNYMDISKIVLKMLSSIPYPIFPLKYGQISTFFSNHRHVAGHVLFTKNWLSWETAHTIYRRVLNRVPGYTIWDSGFFRTKHRSNYCTRVQYLALTFLWENHSLSFFLLVQCISQPKSIGFMV